MILLTGEFPKQGCCKAAVTYDCGAMPEVTLHNGVKIPSEGVTSARLNEKGAYLTVGSRGEPQDFGKTDELVIQMMGLKIQITGDCAREDCQQLRDAGVYVVL